MFYDIILREFVGNTSLSNNFNQIQYCRLEKNMSKCMLLDYSEFLHFKDVDNNVAH